MRCLRSALGGEVISDIHPMGDLCAWSPRPIELVRIEALRGEVKACGGVNRVGDRLARQRGLE